MAPLVLRCQKLTNQIYPFSLSHPLTPPESLLAGFPAHKAFVCPLCKGVTSSDVSVFGNPLICPSTLKRLPFVF